MIEKHGFILEREEFLADINAKASIYSHKKTKARLMHIENDDDNKVFSIGFRTPPETSNGVAHIVEHCVLSGSRKYRTKEPFMDLIKGSLNTFLNAMTYPDKTIYPISSRNEQDFTNLMDVYLDAVFYPRMYEVPEIFYQEGWHYELFDKKDPIIYNGVVYNEMKGAMSSAEAIVEDELSRAIFPDISYGTNSGGEPEVIPSLSYEEFLAFHKKYYHPSNSYIYIYGNGDIDKYLKHIDAEYLSNFEEAKIDSELELQKPFSKRKEETSYYALAESEQGENSDYLSLAWCVGDSSNPEVYYILRLLDEILIDSSAAPLKNALLKSELGEDVFSTSFNANQNYFAICLKNANSKDKTKFVELVEFELKKLVENGIDKKLIEASINKMEFSLREASGNGNKGIIYYISAMNSWLYDLDPLVYFNYSPILKSIKNRAMKGYLESYIEEKILNNTFSALLSLEGKKSLAEEKDEAVRLKLEDYKSKLSEDELNELIQMNEKLKAYQISDDSAEDKATIPRLSLSEINPKAGQFDYNIIKEKGIDIVYSDIFSSKLIYLDFCFDMSALETKYLGYASLLSSLLSEIPTGKYSYEELSNEIFLNMGGLTFHASIFENIKTKKIDPRFNLSLKLLADKSDEALKLLSEICFNSLLDSKKRIKEIIQISKSRIEMNMQYSGNRVATNRALSYFAKAKCYEESIAGLDYYWFLEDLDKNFDEKYDELLDGLNKVYEMIFNKNNLVLAITSDREDYDLVMSKLDSFLDKLSSASLKKQEFNKIPEKLNEGILSSSNVQYVVRAFSVEELGLKPSGVSSLLSSILSTDYLHNNVRAIGGAYGAGIQFDRFGSGSIYSYRDPNLVETLKIYDEMGSYIRNLELSSEDLDNYIIGTVSNFDPVLSPHQRGLIALNRYFSGIKNSDIEKELKEILSASLPELKEYADVLDALMKQNYLCVFGNESKLRGNKDIFTKLVELSS